MKTILFLLLMLGMAFAILPSCPDNSIMDYTSCVCVPIGEQPKQISGGGGGSSSWAIWYNGTRDNETICNITCPSGDSLNTDTCACYPPTPTCAADEYVDTATNTCKKKVTSIIAGVDNMMLMLIVAALVIVGAAAYFFTVSTRKFEMPKNEGIK
jgi:hypothetical protein